MSLLQQQLMDYFNHSDPQYKSDIEEEIWQAYGVSGHIMIMDMSGFSLVTQRYGIVYYLSMIEKMRQVVAPIIKNHQGILVKFVADNVFATFDSAKDAINAAIEINKTLDQVNQLSAKQWDICVSTGIDYGRFLRADDGDIFGDAVNCASKLGEDIAHKNEILVSEKSFSTLDDTNIYQSEHVRFKISGISLEAHSVMGVID